MDKGLDEVQLGRASNTRAWKLGDLNYLFYFPLINFVLSYLLADARFIQHIAGALSIFFKYQNCPCAFFAFVLGVREGGPKIILIRKVDMDQVDIKHTE